MFPPKALGAMLPLASSLQGRHSLALVSITPLFACLLHVSLHVASNLGPTQIIQEYLEILHLVTSAKTCFLNEATLTGSRDEDIGVSFAGGQVASQAAQW